MELVEEEILVESKLKKGYKQTEVGIIPDDWEVKNLNEIGENIIGLTYSPNDIQEFGHLVLRSSNIQNNKLAFENNVFVEMVLPQRVIVKEDDILICVRNGSKNLIGKCALIDKKTAGCAFGAFMSIYRSKYAKYVFYQFQGNNIQKQIDEVMGATINQLTNKDLASFQIPLPPTTTEQTAIATALSDTDDLINSLEKLIEKKRNIKQGAMQKLLQPKEGWEVKKLGEIAEVIGGGTPSTFNKAFWNGSINWFTPTEVGLNKYTFHSFRKITKEGMANCAARLLPIGTVLLTTRAGIGDVSILMNEGCTNQGFQSLIAKDNYNNEFLYYLIQTKKNLLLQNASGSTFLEISPNKLKQIEVIIPALKEQIRVAAILSDMDYEITTLENKLKKYREIKVGMMQNLLTGKIRLI
jgi:type I restriction enzyme S subunit